MSGEYKNIYQKTDEDTYAPSEQTITVAEDAQEVVTAVKITVNKADRGPDDFWSNIGLSEIEIYGEESDIEAAENKNHVNAAGVTAEASTTEASCFRFLILKTATTRRAGLRTIRKQVSRR